MDRELLTVFLLATAVVGGVVYGFSGTDNRNIEDSKTVSCLSEYNQCKALELKERIESCEYWYVGMNRSELDCEYTDKNTEEVGLRTDPANYVEGDFSDLNYTKSVVSDIEGLLWDLEFLRNDSMILTMRNGTVAHFRDDNTSYYSVDTIDKKEAGLMGVAVHPNYPENRKIYLYRTYERTNESSGNSKILRSRISSFILGEKHLKNETVLIDDIPATKYHAGGRIEIGPDKKLYATTGDAENLSAAQDISKLNGKILRMNLDGSIPENNPFNDSRVYSYGHRNPQGLAWNSNGTLFSSEHGDWRYDEVNRIIPGENYGWGIKQCDEFREEDDYNKDFKDPVSCYKNFTLAPSGMTFVNDKNHPWYNNMFLASLRGDHIRNYHFKGNNLEKESIFHYRNQTKAPFYSRRMRDVEFQNGSLYIIGDFAGIIRLKPQN